MRRLVAAAFAGLALALPLALVAPPAFAVEPPPPPVSEVPDIPSRTRTAMGGANEGRVLDMWRSILRASVAPGTDLVHVPKPITAPAALPRVVSSGAPTAGFFAGYAIGKGGLAVYALASGTSYEAMHCSTPGWYQAVDSFISLGLAPDCAAVYSSFGLDVLEGGVLTYGTYVRSTAGSQNGTSNGEPATQWCGPSSGSVGSGNAIRLKEGFTSYGGFNSMNQPGTCWVSDGGPYVVERFPTGWSAAGPRDTGAPIYQVYNVNTGATLAESSPVTLKAAKDATRTPGCRIDWEDGSFTTGTGPTYTEAAGLPLEPSKTGCKSAWDAKPGAGTVLLPSRIRTHSQDGGGAITEIADQEVPEMGDVERQALQPSPVGAGGLRLEKVLGTVVGNCMTWEADCADWWTKTSSGTQPTTGDETFRCSYQGAAVALAECGVYRHTFDTKTSTPTITDPATGTQQPWESQPSTGNSTDPSTGPTPGEDCFGSWPSVANPIDWVLHPIKCAFVWGFVPRGPVVESAVKSADDAWAGKPPAVIATFLGGLNLTPEPEGCAVPATLFGITFNVIDNCPGSFMGPIMAISKIVTSLGMLILVIVVVRRQIAGMVGYDNDH